MSSKITILSGDELSDEELAEFNAQVEQFMASNAGNAILNLMRPDAAVLMAYPNDALLCNCISDDASSWVH